VLEFLRIKIKEVCLAEVIIGENESFEAALKRFTKRVQQDGILAEARRREHYEKPSIRRKKKAAAKRRKSRKAAA
jgi:small subunit ribosomal protein S21